MNKEILTENDMMTKLDMKGHVFKNELEVIVISKSLGYVPYILKGVGPNNGEVIFIKTKEDK